MATQKGIFDPTLVDAGWYGSDGQLAGWFDETLIDTAGAAAANFVGTAAITFGQTGALAATSVLAGTIPATFGQTGAFNAGSSYAGTIPVTFGQTGAFNGGAGLAGSIPVTFGQSGTLGAETALTGSASVTVGQSGGFLAETALAGSASVVFGQSGDFVAGVASGASNFAGTVSITFGQSGDFQGTTAFAGSADVVFNQAGTFTAGSVAPDIPAVSGGGLYISPNAQRAIRKEKKRREDAQEAIRRDLVKAYERITGEITSEHVADVIEAVKVAETVEQYEAVKEKAEAIDLASIKSVVVSITAEIERLKAEALAREEAEEEDAIVALLMAA